MKYVVRINYEGAIEKTVEANSVEEAEELAQDWWANVSDRDVAENAQSSEIDVDEAE